MVGTPHVNNYVLGRGEVAIAKFTDAVLQIAGSFRYIGNTPAFGTATATTDLDHYSSDHGIKTKDQTVTLQVDKTGTFTCDDISLDNLVMSFLGSKATVLGVAGTVTAEAHNGVYAGGMILLGVSSSNPAGRRDISAITALTDDTPTTPVVYTAGTDYTFDATTGQIHLVTGGAIIDGKNLRATYTTVATNKFDQTLAGNTPFEGAMMFTAYNPVGNQIDYFIPWIKITPDGTYDLKGDVWQEMKFKYTILDPRDGRAAVYMNGRPYAAS